MASEGVDITKTHVPIVYVVVIVGAIVGAALAVNTTYTKQTFEVQMLRKDVSEMPKKKDLDDAYAKVQAECRDIATQRTLFLFEHAALRVSAVPGKRYMRGKFEWPIKVDEEQ
jgi:hypothetical protein